MKDDKRGRAVDVAVLDEWLGFWVVLPDGVFRIRAVDDRTDPVRVTLCGETSPIEAYLPRDSQVTVLVGPGEGPPVPPEPAPTVLDRIGRPLAVNYRVRAVAGVRPGNIGVIQSFRMVGMDAYAWTYWPSEANYGAVSPGNVLRDPDLGAMSTDALFALTQEWAASWETHKRGPRFPTEEDYHEHHRSMGEVWTALIRSLDVAGPQPPAWAVHAAQTVRNLYDENSRLWAHRSTLVTAVPGLASELSGPGILRDVASAERRAWLDAQVARDEAEFGEEEEDPWPLPGEDAEGDDEDPQDREDEPLICNYGWSDGVRRMACTLPIDHDPRDFHADEETGGSIRETPSI